MNQYKWEGMRSNSEPPRSQDGRFWKCILANHPNRYIALCWRPV